MLLNKKNGKIIFLSTFVIYLFFLIGCQSNKFEILAEGDFDHAAFGRRGEKKIPLTIVSFMDGRSYELEGYMPTADPFTRGPVVYALEYRWGFPKVFPKGTKLRILRKSFGSFNKYRIVKVEDKRAVHFTKHLLGHSDEVSAIAFSLDGKILATGSYDMTTKLWDVQTGQLKRTFKGHTGSITSVNFSPDGKNIATGCGMGPSSGNLDTSVRLWATNTGELKHKLNTDVGIYSTIWDLVFSPDGKTLVAFVTMSFNRPGGYRVKKIVFWDTKSGEKKMVLLEDDQFGYPVFSPDWKYFAAAYSWDEIVKIWNPLTGEKIQELKTGKVSSMDISSDGKILATSADMTVKIWNTKTWELRTLEGYREKVTSVVFSEDGKTLASIGDRTVILWDSETWEIKQRVRAYITVRAVRVKYVGLSPNLTLVHRNWGFKRSLNEGHTVSLFDLHTQKSLLTFKVDNGEDPSFTFSPDGKTLAVLKGKKVTLWIPTGQRR